MKSNILSPLEAGPKVTLNFFGEDRRRFGYDTLQGSWTSLYWAVVIQNQYLRR